MMTFFILKNFYVVSANMCVWGSAQDLSEYCLILKANAKKTGCKMKVKI
jgi:hypothetical protein